MTFIYLTDPPLYLSSSLERENNLHLLKSRALVKTGKIFYLVVRQLSKTAQTNNTDIKKKERNRCNVRHGQRKVSCALMVLEIMDWQDKSGVSSVSKGILDEKTFFNATPLFLIDFEY